MGKDLYALLIFDDRISLAESLQLTNICIYVIIFYSLLSIIIISILYKQGKQYEDNYSFDEFQKKKVLENQYNTDLRNKNQKVDLEMEYNTQHTIHSDFYDKSKIQEKGQLSPR